MPRTANSFNLGAYLKAAREKAGLSQSDVAAKLGLKTPQSVSDWERNHGSTLPCNSFIKLVSIYGLPGNEAYRVLMEYELARTRSRLERDVLPQIKRKTARGRG